jgi:hypothetical protein
MEVTAQPSPHSTAITMEQRKLRSLQLEDYLNTPNSRNCSSHKRSLDHGRSDRASDISQSSHHSSSRCSSTGRARNRSQSRSRRSRDLNLNSSSHHSRRSRNTTSNSITSTDQYVSKRPRSINGRHDKGKEDSIATKSTEDDLSMSDTTSGSRTEPNSPLTITIEGDDVSKSLSSTEYLRQRRSDQSNQQEDDSSTQADSKSLSSPPSGTIISGNRSGGSVSKHSKSHKDSQWLASREKRQDAIVYKERLETELLTKKEVEMNKDIYQCDERNPFEHHGLDSDAPIGIQHRRERAAVLKDVLAMMAKTAGKTKNAALHPKRTAKFFAKTTVNAVRDPRKAAINVGKATKNVTVGTVRVGAGLTMGVTKGTLGATRTVAKGTFKGTTAVVGGTLNRAGKVVKGTAHLITGHHRSDHGSEDETYDSSKLSERQSSSLMDRVNGMMDSSPSTSELNHGSSNELADLKEHAAMLRRASLSSEGRRSSRRHVLDRQTSLRMKKERRSLVRCNMDKFLLSFESEENKEIWDL